MTKRAKGNYYETKAKKQLEAQGYKVEKARPQIVRVKGRVFCKKVDFFRLFDLIAINEKKTRLIQVKFLGEGNEGWKMPGLQKEISQFPKGGAGTSRELWIYRRLRGKSTLEIYLAEGTPLEKQLSERGVGL